jgi:hypothetical protein
MNFINLLKSSNSNYTLIRATNNNQLNGINLLEKYNSLSNSNLSNLNRYTILLEPGVYDLKNSSLILNKDFIDIIGTDPSSKSVVKSTIGIPLNGVINQIADNVKLVNLQIANVNTTYSYPWVIYHYILSPNELNYYENLLHTVPCAYFRNIPINISKGNTYLENVIFESINQSIFTTRIGVDYDGEYKDCEAGPYAFGFKGTANGKYINCKAREFSFGSFGSEVNGYFENCIGGSNCFGYSALSVKGLFKNCSANNKSFGIDSIQNNGQFINCNTEFILEG